MPTGQATSYDLLVGVVVDMDEAIYMLSPEDTPLLTGMGADGLSVIGSEPATQTEVTWMDDTLLTPRSNLAGAATTGDTFITLKTGDRTKFSTGDVIRVAKSGGAGTGEIMRITGYGATAETVTVTRGYAGAATNYASGDIVIGLGTSLAEGSDPEAARTVDRVQNTNITQIFGPTAVHMSGTEQVVRKYGVRDEQSRQLMGRTKENAIAREQAFLYGVRTNSTTTKIRTTGGLAFYIVSNVSTATTLTVATITTVEQTQYNNGGVPSIVMANPASLADLNDTANTAIVRTDIMDPRRGRVAVTQVFTEFGPLTVVRNRWCASFDAFLWNREQVKRRPLRPLQFERLAKTGDADKGQIVCEEALEVKGEEHCARFNSLVYSGAA